MTPLAAVPEPAPPTTIDDDHDVVALLRSTTWHSLGVRVDDNAGGRTLLKQLKLKLQRSGIELAVIDQLKAFPDLKKHSRLRYLRDKRIGGVVSSQR